MIGLGVAEATTALFVPGNRAERFAKAAASGADLVIIDLEDAVASEHKREAREATFRALTDPAVELSAAVRMNALASGGFEDLQMLAQLASAATGRLQAVLLPKAESVADIVALAEVVSDVPLIPLIETAAGVAVLDSLAQAPQVVRLAFGALDFGVDVDATSPIMLDYVRCALVLSSRAAGIAKPLDSPNPEFRDAGIVSHSAAAARALGFGGQLCIHPLQVPLVAGAFRPTAEEAAWAERVVATGEGGLRQVDGAMVDRPVFLRAIAILARSAS